MVSGSLVSDHRDHAAQPSGIVLTGTRGVGKTTIAHSLHVMGVGAHVPCVTTRPPRSDDAGHYDYLTLESFEREAAAGEYFYIAEYCGSKYAVRLRETQHASSMGEPPILTLAPAAAIDFFAGGGRPNWLGVYVDAPDDLLDTRLAARNRSIDKSTVEQRAADRALGSGSLPVVVNDQSIDTAIDAILKVLNLAPVGGR